MKKILLSAILIATVLTSFAQVGIGTNTPNVSAALDVESTTLGFLPPRMTSAEMTAIASPAEGLTVYCNDCTPKSLYFFDGTAYIAAVDGTVVSIPAPAAIGDLRDGGIVFWVDPSDNTHGLVCALADYGTAEWGCLGTDLSNVTNVTIGPSGLGAEIGDGMGNTNNILIDCPTAPAALAARSYGTEWFLPSAQELNKMYVNKATLEAVAGFTSFGSNPYWSSTEYNSNYAWEQNFLTGNQNLYDKSFTTYVRAVRAF